MWGRGGRENAVSRALPTKLAFPLFPELRAGGVGVGGEGYHGPSLLLSLPIPTLQGRDPDGLFAEDNVVACVLDMVMAGTETTSSTLQWAALLMGKHPGVQGGCAEWVGRGPPGPREGLAGRPAPTLLSAGRVQAELDRVLGPGRPPQPEDQRSLPYTNAVLHEVQRLITLLPHVPRCTAAATPAARLPAPQGGRPGLAPTPRSPLSAGGPGGLKPGLPPWGGGGGAPEQQTWVRAPGECPAGGPAPAGLGAPGPPLPALRPGPAPAHRAPSLAACCRTRRAPP